MSEVPTPVSESTAIEIVRKEGSARSVKAVNTITAGDLLWLPNASGATQTVTFSGTRDTVIGAALYSAVSGGRVTTIKGKVQVKWDGAGSPIFGSPIAPSTVRSGWFEFSSGTAAPIGILWGSIVGAGFAAVAGNSGTLLVVEI